MGNLAVSEKKQLNMRIFHLCVVALFTLGFGHLPTFSTVTPYGMKALGCFLGILYGWVFVDMLWTSLMVFVLVPFTGLITADGLITAGFGNVVVMQVCFILMLFSVVSNTEIPSKITNKLLGMKICTGKPWVFVGVLLFATWVEGTFPNETIKNFLGLFGSISFCFIGMMVLLWIKIDGEPITNMPQMAKGMSWDTLLTVASMQPVLAFISADEAGIKAMLSDVCGPIIANLSPLMFVLFVIVICGLLTNILNNAACCLMFFPIVMIYAPQLGLSAIGMVFSFLAPIIKLKQRENARKAVNAANAVMPK